MAGRDLITAQLDILATRLPSQVVEELADGLEEAYELHLHACGDPEQAARAAIAEFGDADTVTAAFLRESPWHRTAIVLLLTGPLMAAAWAVTLLTAGAWTWSLPLPAKILYGAALVTIVCALLFVVREKLAYRRTRLAMIGSVLGLIVLDVLMLTVIAVMTPVPVWPMAVAVPASAIRILSLARRLPAVIAA
ncbi:permease prefix domain 1-containing protein [Streptosporangium sp. NPDC049046]|uniref:permease prefix domain 1-containing protein n=1 Tax=Streptosporangium sp. NPDC049046 TaxID=3155031 RepID=UPI00341E7AF8